MELEYKESCERCMASLTWVDRAFVCGSECTFCGDCTGDLGHVCPNCSDALSLRPARTQKISPTRRA